MRRSVARHLLRGRVRELARVRLAALHLTALRRCRLAGMRVQGVVSRIDRLVMAVRQMRRAEDQVSAVLGIVFSSLAIPYAVVVNDDLDRVHRDVAPPVARMGAAVVGQRVHEVSPEVEEVPVPAQRVEADPPRLERVVEADRQRDLVARALAPAAPIGLARRALDVVLG